MERIFGYRIGNACPCGSERDSDGADSRLGIAELYHSGLRGSIGADSGPTADGRNDNRRA